MSESLAPAWLQLEGAKRRWVQAVLYEVVAVSVVAPVLSIWFDHDLRSAVGLSVLLSAVAMAFNFIYNAAFEAWEARQAVKGRSWQRRLVHGFGFELGLALMLIPVMAWWLGVTWWEALLADVALIAFFFVYTIVFTWCFDRVFGLPASARRESPLPPPSV